MDSVHSIISNFSTLLTVWDEAIGYVKNTEMRSRIRGVSLFMRKFDFCLEQCLVSASCGTVTTLARFTSQQVSAADSQKMAALTVKTLETLRNDAAFGLFGRR